jgi:hypothetical protein
LNGDEVWARLLENRLKSSGLDLKVYNLGVPGTDTSFHLEVADRYIRQLKPKFVVVSVLMGDDFAQVLASKFSKSVWSAILKAAKSNAIRLFPGLHKFYVHARYFNFGPHVRDSSYSRYSRSQAVLSITKDWAEESLRVIRDKKLDLPDDILAHAAAGDINPGLLQTPAAAAAPSRSRESLDKIEKVRRKVLVELTNRFSDIGSLARRHGGRLIIFGMPNGAFVNSAVTANYRKYGMSVTDVDLVTREPEAILQQMARNSDALFVPSLSEFREHRGTELFFPLDGHLTPEGSRLVANIIGNALLGRPGNR